MSGPDDRPQPRDVHPAFYGSFDWHSCVEMHWMLIRLLKSAPEALPQERVRAGLAATLQPHALATEAAYFETRTSWGRPYGWGWALALAYELASWDDDDGRAWSAAMQPLAEVLCRRFKEWLPKADFPVRHGVHPNSAFGLSRALGYGRLLDAGLVAAIATAARRWFMDDADYPAHYEPSGADFLSAALTEAELMAQLLEPVEFSAWLARFLPGMGEGSPSALFSPVPVSDPTDGQIAHLHGLNLSRAWCLRRIREALPHDDPRGAVARAAEDRHRVASLDQAAGSDYMVEHWLAAYAVLLLS